MAELEKALERQKKSKTIFLNFDEVLSEFKVKELDLKDALWQGMVVKEDLFRAYLTELNSDDYENSFVRIFCSEDAIIPTWAYMLLADKLSNAQTVVFGDAVELNDAMVAHWVKARTEEEFTGKRVILKGCAQYELSPSTYMLVTQYLSKRAKKLYFGEPCSTVPVF